MQTSTPLSTSQRAQLVRRSHLGRQLRQGLRSGVLHAVLIIGALAMATPFIWMVSTSFKTLDQVFTYPPKWIPDPFIWTNYPAALTVVPFGTWFLNSLNARRSACPQADMVC